LEIWGQWVYGDKVFDKLKLTYSGEPSVFEAKTSPPAGLDETKLQILAADRAGNSGQHAIVYRITK
jgi:hypothetical protein